MKVIIVLGSTFLYVVISIFLLKASPDASALVAVPVALTGWYFGIAAGLIASAAGMALSSLLLASFGGSGTWLAWLISDWPGNLMLAGAGFLGGRLQEMLSARLSLLKEGQSRDRYLTLVNMTIRDILAPPNVEDRYHYLVAHLVNLFVADYAYFVRWDATREQAYLAASTVPLEEPTSEIALGPDESVLAVSVLSTGRSLVLEDVPHSDHLVKYSIFKGPLFSPQSAVCIPFIAGDQKLGAAVIAYDGLHHFEDKEINYAEFAADQFALALWTVQQELEINKQLKVANTLVSIERALSQTERVGLKTVLQLIVDSARELIPGAENAVLHLLDSDQKTLIPRAVSGEDNKTRTTVSMRLGEGVAGQAIADGAVIGVSDILSDPRFVNPSTAQKVRSLVVAPIRSGERPFGSISVYSDHPHSFTSEAIGLLGALGTQAAIAIENTNLLETTRQDLREINTLYHLSRGLASSLDPDQLMKDVVDLLKTDFDYYHVQIFVLDPESGDLIARRGSGKIGDQLLEQKYTLPAGAGIAGYVVDTGQPFVTNRTDDVLFFVRSPLLPDTQSELAVPIKIENNTIGVLDIQQIRPGLLSDRDVQLMGTVADQLAVAWQQARLYTELQTSLTQEKAIHAQLIQSERLAVVGRLLASVSHELNNPLQAIQNALFLIKDEESLSMQGRQDLEIILSEAERMSILLERLHTAFRPTRTEDFQVVELNRIIESVIALTTTHMRHKEITLEFFPDPELPSVSAIPDQMRQVVLNLFMNAVDAMQSGGNLSVETHFMQDEEQVLLTVADTGNGIDPDVLPRIFEPFVTSKESGTGLGLAISHDIIRQHGGTISAGNNPQGGAIFKVWLPASKRV